MLGLGRRRDPTPARAASRNRWASSYEAPLDAANPLQFGRAAQLPPFGRGNGLDALFWTPLARLPADRIDEVLAVLAARDIPAWAAPVRHDRGRAEHRPHDLWAASLALDEAQDLLARVLADRP